MASEEEVHGDYPQGDVPGVRHFPAPGIKNPAEAEKAASGGEIAEEIAKLKATGAELEVKWQAGEIIVYVKKHKTEIAVAATAVGVAAGIIAREFSRRRGREKRTSPKRGNKK